MNQELLYGAIIFISALVFLAAFSWFTASRPDERHLEKSDVISSEKD